MSFTSPTLVKKHLLTSPFPELVIRNHVVTLNGTTPVELPHHNLVTNSEAVKWDVSTAPYLDDSLSMKGDDFLKLS